MIEKKFTDPSKSITDQLAEAYSHLPEYEKNLIKKQTQLDQQRAHKIKLQPKPQTLNKPANS